LILFFVVRPLIAVLTSPSDGGTRAGLATGAAGETGAALSPMAVGQARVEGLPGSSNHAQILDMAKNNPESTALVVKQWLNNNA
jgi:flagellar M-ring protein FliF